MSLGANKAALMGAAGGGAAGAGFYDYQIANSVRMHYGDNDSKITRTPSGAGNQATWSISMWMKRATLGANQFIFEAGASGDYSTRLFWLFAADNGIEMSSGTVNYGTTTEKFRDTSAWYHIFIKNASNSNTLYVNGTLIKTTALSGNTAINSTGTHGVGTRGGSGTGDRFGGYVAEFLLFDGTAYDPTDVAEEKNGVWIPKDPSGLTLSGTNTTWLKFANSGALGTDSSGEGNTWTIGSAISADDQTLDSPSFGSEGSANFATLGPLWKTPDMTFSEGNLKWSTSTNQRGAMSNWAIPLEGKWYFEYIPTGWGASAGDDQWLGLNIATVDFTASRGGMGTAYGYGANQGKKVIVGTESSYGATWTTNDIIGVAVDRVNDTIQFYKNNSGQGTFAIPATGDLFPWIGSGGGSSAASGTFNFGGDGTFGGLISAAGNSDGSNFGNFKYAPPTDFLALCAGNQPTAEEVDPAETDDNYPQKQFNMLQYTGNGSERTLTTQFQIDMSWARSTVQAQDWYVLDTSRGFFGTSSNNKYLKLDTTDDEDTLPQYNFKAQSGNDITLTGGTSFNSGSHTQQMWYWKGNGGTTSTPAGGSLATTVQVNTASGFSIIQYVGDGGTSNFTLAHGLGKKPNMVLMKDRDHNGNNNGFLCFPVNTPLTANTYFYTSSADAAGTSTNGSISNTTTTDTVIGVNRTSSTGGGQTISESGDNFLMYAFANIEGYSKFSSYVGNNNADGPFVYCGFTPAFIAIKDMGTPNEWRVFDTLNNPYNVSTEWLVLNSNAAISTASTTNDIDILSNGFKIRGTAGNTNISGTSYFFMAWASNPFAYATAR